MPNRIRKEDVNDLDFVDAFELGSTGTTVYRSSAAVTSTTSGSQQVVITAGGLQGLAIPNDQPSEAGDFIVLSGNAAAGQYTIASIVDDFTLTTVESIVTSTGGSANFLYPAGATRLGVDTTALTGVTASATTVQAVLAQVASNAFSAMANQNYSVVTRTMGRISMVSIYTDNTLATALGEVTITRNGSGRIITVVETQRNSSSTLLKTITTTIGRTGNVISSVTVTTVP